MVAKKNTRTYNKKITSSSLLKCKTEDLKEILHNLTPAEFSRIIGDIRITIEQYTYLNNVVSKTIKELYPDYFIANVANNNQYQSKTTVNTLPQMSSSIPETNDATFELLYGRNGGPAPISSQQEHPILEEKDGETYISPPNIVVDLDNVT
jgi:hypothetical protein